MARKITDPGTTTITLAAAKSGGNVVYTPRVGADERVLASDFAEQKLTTQGDLLRRGASADERLPVGSEGQVLKVISGVPAWGTDAGGSPGGSDGQVQYNNGGSFGGNAGLTFDDSNIRLGVGTSSPQRSLHVLTSVGGSVGAWENTVGNNGTSIVESFRFTTTGGGGAAFQELAAITVREATADHATRSSSFAFYTVSNASGAYRWFIDGAGNTLFNGGENAANVAVAFNSNVGPQVDNSYSCGTASYKWSVVYAATGTINTSDGRFKLDVEDSDLGLDFINALRPVSFRHADGRVNVEQVDETYTEIEQAVRVEQRSTEVVKIIDGQPRVVIETRAFEVPLFEHKPVIGLNGKPVRRRVPYTNPNGKQRTRWETVTHPVPVMVTVTKTRKVDRVTEAPGERTHYGLIAQEVKKALDGAGIRDFAGWTLADVNDPDSRQGLRMDQFIPVLIKAVQELSARVAELESRRS